MHKIAAVANIYSSFNFVPSEHPYDNPSLFKGSDGFRDLILEAVFNTGYSQ